MIQNFDINKNVSIEIPIPIKSNLNESKSIVNEQVDKNEVLENQTVQIDNKDPFFRKKVKQLEKEILFELIKKYNLQLESVIKKISEDDNISQIKRSLEDDSHLLKKMLSEYVYFMIRSLKKKKYGVNLRIFFKEDLEKFLPLIFKKIYLIVNSEPTRKNLKLLYLYASKIKKDDLRTVFLEIIKKVLNNYYENEFIYYDVHENSQVSKFFQILKSAFENYIIN